LDHFSLSYDKKNFGVFSMPQSVVYTDSLTNGWITCLLPYLMRPKTEPNQIVCRYITHL